MKAGDLVKIKHEGWFQHNGKTHLITKIEVKPSIQANRMITWAHLLGFPYRVEKEHLEVLNESR